MATVEEIERGTSGSGITATVRFLIRDAFSFAEAQAILDLDAVPPNGTGATFAGLEKQQANITEISQRLGLWYGDVEYSLDGGKRVPLPTNTEPGPTNQIDTYSFDVSVRDQTVLWLADLPEGESAVKEVLVGDKPGGGSFTIYEREGINWQGPERGYEGAVIPRPQGSFNLGYTPARTGVTQSFLNQVEAAVGRTNSATFFDKAPGEVLFAGARGEGRTQESWHFTYTFWVRKNRASLVVGNGMTFTNVGGWEYIEVTMFREKQTPAAGEIIITETPRQARRIAVFEQINFNTELFV